MVAERWKRRASARRQDGLSKTWALAPARTNRTGAKSPIRGKSIPRRAEARRFHPIFIPMGEQRAQCDDRNDNC